MSRRSPAKSSSKSLTGVGVASLMRERIVSGRYRPGDRLPPQRELAAEVGVSFVTMQGALETLRRDGFVEPRGPLGTFVSLTPPHLCRVALVFELPPEAQERPWSRFYRAIHASSQERIGDVQIRSYHGVSGHSDCEDTVRLVSDMSAHRVGGLIFAASPFHLAGSPLLEEPGIPRVSISSELTEWDIPSVCPDRLAFFDRAVRHLAEHGRKRPAILWAALSPSAPFDKGSLGEVHAFESAVASAGMTTRAWWMQGINPNSAGWAQNNVRALFHADQRERPDSLIIADDNLVEHATAGLIAAGVVPPRDVHVIAYANYPFPPRPNTPATLLGYDARRLVRTCVERLAAQRQGLRFPKSTLLPPLLEHEVSL